MAPDALGPRNHGENMTPPEKLRFAHDLLAGCHLLPQPAQQARAVLADLLLELLQEDRRPEPPRFRLPGVSRAPDER